MFKNKKSAVITLIVSLIVIAVAITTIMFGGEDIAYCLFSAILFIIFVWMFPHMVILGLILWIGIIFVILSLITILRKGEHKAKAKNLTSYKTKLIWSIIFVCVCAFVMGNCLFNSSNNYKTIQVNSNVVEEFTLKYECDEVFDGIEHITIRKNYKDGTKSVECYQKYYISGGALYGYDYGYNADENELLKALDNYEQHGLYTKCVDADGTYILIDWFNCGLLAIFTILEACAIIGLVCVIKSKNNHSAQNIEEQTSVNNG